MPQRSKTFLVSHYHTGTKHRSLSLFPSLLLSCVATAQCIVGNTNAPGSDPTNVEIGQSFMPTCDGEVEYVEIYCTTGGTNVAGQLKIYSGSTVTSTPIHTQAQPATVVNAGEALRIYLTAPITATAFSQLTFEVPMSLTIPFSGGNPYPSGRMFYNGTNSSVYANSDIRFAVSIISNCTNTTASVTATACDSYTAPSGAVFTTSGAYTDIIPNVQGCDSIISIDLEVIDLDTTVTVDGLQLTANEANASYLWFNCTTGAPVLSATEQSFTPTEAGSYSVQLSFGDCFGTSACFFVGSTSVNEAADNLWRVLPTSAAGVVRVAGLTNTVQLALFDATGRSVPFTRDGELLAMEAHTGCYVLRLHDAGRAPAALRFVLP